MDRLDAGEHGVLMPSAGIGPRNGSHSAGMNECLRQPDIDSHRPVRRVDPDEPRFVATVALVQGAASQQARRRSTARRRVSRPIRTKTFAVCDVCLKPACRCPQTGQSEATTTIAS